MYDSVTFHGKTFKPFITNAELEAAIDRIAEKVNAEYGNSDEVPIFLCVLNGAIMFTASMMRRLNFTAELMSIKLSSYQGTESTGTVLIPLGLTGDVTGRRVLIFEDIVDTGNTIVALKEILMDKGAKDVKICTMLSKPEIYKKSDKLDFVGMEIENKFIVGYGLDYDEYGRNLTDIYALDK